MKKVCTKCLVEKPLQDFYRKKVNIDGYNHHCKKCVSKYVSEWKKKNPDKVVAGREKYRKKYPERISAYNKKYKEKNSERVYLVKRKWEKNNPEKIATQGKRYRKKYPDKVATSKKKWRDNNPEKIALYSKRSYERDNKIRKKMSNAINDSLIRRNSSKNGLKTWRDILPYTPDDLRVHLESLFKPGMTWKNHGTGKNKWGIDHIIPDSWFDYKNINDESFKQSWDLSNLQPMWHRENISKGNRYAGDYNPDF